MLASGGGAFLTREPGEPAEPPRLARLWAVPSVFAARERRERGRRSFGQVAGQYPIQRQPPLADGGLLAAPAGFAVALVYPASRVQRRQHSRQVVAFGRFLQRVRREQVNPAFAVGVQPPARPVQDEVFALGVAVGILAGKAPVAVAGDEVGDGFKDLPLFRRAAALRASPSGQGSMSRWIATSPATA